MDIFLLYLWTRLDGLLFVSGFIVLVGIIATFILVVIGHLDEDKKLLNLAKTGAKVTIGAVLVSLVIPSQKDAAIIAGGWAVKQVATSEGAQQLSSKTFALINGKLDEELAKLKKETKDGFSE